MKTSATATIEAENSFTGWCSLGGYFQVSIASLDDSTVTFQATPDAGVTVYDVETWTGTAKNGVHIGFFPPVGWQYRVGVKTGGYGTEVSVLVRIDA